MKIILGSTSRPRKQLLESWGWEFEIQSPIIDEKSVRSEDFKQLPLLVARAKAENLKARIREPAIVITTDSVVVSEGQLREKPVDENQAREYLRSYGTAPIEIHSAVVVFNTKTGKSREGVATAKLYFQKFSEYEINDLISHGEVLTGAGALVVSSPAIQKQIVHLDGDLDTAIGLSKTLVTKFVEELKN